MSSILNEDKLRDVLNTKKIVFTKDQRSIDGELMVKGDYEIVKTDHKNGQFVLKDKHGTTFHWKPSMKK